MAVGMSAIGTKRTISASKLTSAHRLEADVEADARRLQRVRDAPLTDTSSYQKLAERVGFNPRCG